MELPTQPGTLSPKNHIWHRVSGPLLPGSEWPFLAIIVVFSVLAAIPVGHDLKWLGDEGIWLRAGMEMLRGGVPYRDFFELQGPLPFYVVAGWLAAFGQSLEAARALSATIATLTAITIYFLCRRVSKSPPIAVFLSLIWILASQGENAELSHHSITTLLSIFAIFFTLNGNPLVAGILSGGACISTQTRGALCVVAAFFSLPLRNSSLLRFFFGVAFPPVLFGIYLLAHNAALQAWQDAVLWPLTNYSGIQGVPFGYLASLVSMWAPLLYLFSFSGAAILWRKFKTRTVYRTCLAFAFAGLLGSYPRPDATHLAWTLPLALPLTAIVAQDLAEMLSRRWRLTAVTLILTFALSTLAIFTIQVILLARVPITATRAGGVAFRDPQESDMVRHVLALPQGDPVFFYPYMPMVPFLTRHVQVGRYDIILPHYTDRVQYQDAVSEVAGKARWVVYDRRDSDPRHMKEVFPSMPDGMPAEYRSLENLLKARFITVWSNERFEIRRVMSKKPTPSPFAVVGSQRPEGWTERASVALNGPSAFG